MRFLPIVAIALVPLVSGVAVHSDRVPCNSPVVTSKTYIGENKDVAVETIVCNDPPVSRELQKRQSSNICGATCKYRGTVCGDEITYE